MEGFFSRRFITLPRAALLKPLFALVYSLLSISRGQMAWAW